MAEFHDIVVTQAGLKLIALSAAMEKPIVFDRMDIGDSRPSDASAIATMTAIVDKKIEGTISDLGVVNNTDATEARYRILAKYSNSTLTTGFKISEVGVIAHVESNYYKDDGWGGYAGESVLLAISTPTKGKKIGFRRKTHQWMTFRWARTSPSVMGRPSLSTSMKKIT